MGKKVCRERECVEFRYVAETVSTNTLLKQLAKEGAADGTVLVADRQTGGHGRFGRAFFSPEGGLYMSVLLRRRLQPEYISLVTVAAAEAAAEAAEALCGAPVGIKWVNDLYLGGRKVCGILAEATANPAEDELCVVVGFGVNIAPPKGGFPAEIREVAGALLSAPDVGARDRLAVDVAERFLRYADTLVARDYLPGYRRRMVLQGREVAYTENGMARRGVVLGVDDSGALLVQLTDGATHRLMCGEVTMHDTRPMVLAQEERRI